MWKPAMVTNMKRWNLKKMKLTCIRNLLSLDFSWYRMMQDPNADHTGQQPAVHDVLPYGSDVPQSKGLRKGCLDSLVYIH